MFRKRKREDVVNDAVPAPAEVPPIEGENNEEVSVPARGRRIWPWALTAALAGGLLVAFVIVLGVLGFYDGLRDRAMANRQIAQEHYALGLAHLESDNYELAIAEFELAKRHDSSLRGLRDRLREAKELARSQITPTSETRRDASALLYKQAVPHYEGGNLAQAVAMLEELRGLDAGYQRENVETMLVKAHYQLGLNDVQEDRLDDAARQFEAVMALEPGHEMAQDQINLLDLYTAALNHWERDWSATIQALKGLYALAPDYKDVQARLHNAYTFRAQEYVAEGDWCRASDEYAGAVEVFPLEATVDKRDDAAFRCQATVEAPTPTPTPQVTAGPAATPTAGATAVLPAAATSTPAVAAAGKGRITFTSFDAARQRYDLYVADLSRGDARLLRENASQPAFSSRDGRLVFRNHEPFHLGLGILDLVTNEVLEMTAHAEDSTPAWSPDGAHIAFASDKHGDRKWRIYVISPGEVRGEGQPLAFGQMPAWSPDSSRVAFHGCDERGDNCGVRAIRTSGAEPVRLTTDPSDTAPNWAPDGSRVAFISARGGNWDLYLVDVATGQETRLTDHPAADVAPAWSPDGKRLAFLSNRDGACAMYVLELRSGQVQQVIATGDAYPDAVGRRLSWAP